MMRFEKDSRYNRFGLCESKKSKDLIARESKKSPDEKVDMWMSGEREINLAACSPDKLRLYYSICLRKDFTKGAREIEKVAKSRNIDLENDMEESCGKCSFGKSLYRSLMNSVSESLYESVEEDGPKPRITDWREVARRIEAEKKMTRRKRMGDIVDEDPEESEEEIRRNIERFRKEQERRLAKENEIAVPRMKYYKPKDREDLRNFIHKMISRYGKRIDLNFIDVSEIHDMSYMFMDLDDVYFDISRWDVSGVTVMRSMFMGCHDFNCDITGWDVSNVRDMRSMFANCISFNQPIGGWDVSSVNMMTNMFRGCKAFNQPLGDWDVSGVEQTNGMFAECDRFNQPLPWDVRKVQNMSHMFYKCVGFCQDLSGWELRRDCQMNLMFDGTTMPERFRPSVNPRRRVNESVERPGRFDLKGLKNCLTMFETDGRYAKYGHWSIGRGGYDLEFELYYDGVQVLDCVTRQLEVAYPDDMENIDDVIRIVLKVYPDCRYDWGEGSGKDYDFNN